MRVCMNSGVFENLNTGRMHANRVGLQAEQG